MINKNVLFLIPCTLAIIAAGTLMWFEKQGWGWMVFIAVCTFVYPSATKTENQE